jgi:hypothetical protein
MKTLANCSPGLFNGIFWRLSRGEADQIFKHEFVRKLESLIFAARIYGGLAQLARAFAWHAKGHRFDSGNLH